MTWLRMSSTIFLNKAPVVRARSYHSRAEARITDRQAFPRIASRGQIDLAWCGAVRSLAGLFSNIGETGFEPATARPPAECATRLRHSPWGIAF